MFFRKLPKFYKSFHINHDANIYDHTTVSSKFWHLQALLQSQVSATAQLWYDGCSEQSRNSHLNTRVSDKRFADTTAEQADLGIPARKHHVRNGRVSIESHFARTPSGAHLSQSAAALCSRADKDDRICPRYFRTNRTRMPLVRRASRLPRGDIIALLLSSSRSRCARGRASGTDGRPGCREIDEETDGEKYAAGRSKQVSCTKVSTEGGRSKTPALIPARTS